MPAYYEILGLDSPPLDLKTVKKAYAKALRETRPDDDPAGFMKLREAYDIAKDEIAYQQANADYIDTSQDSPADNAQEGPVTDSASEGIVSEDIVSEDRDSAAATHISDDALKALLDDTPPDEAAMPIAAEAPAEDIPHTGDQILMSRLMKAYKDPFLKNDKAHWAKLLDEKTALSIDEYQDFDARLRNALIDTYNQWIEDKAENKSKRRPFSSAIENLIFDKMDWRFLQEEGSYKSQQINWLKSQMDLFNRPAPRHVQQARAMSQQQAVEFEDDDDSLGKIIWRVIRVIIIFVVISQFFKLFGS